MSKRNRVITRDVLLRTVASINAGGSLASAKRVAEELQIPQEDARKLCADEVAVSMLAVNYSDPGMKYRFVYYTLTPAATTTLSEVA